jgi:type IV pilus assembly protein PilC
MSQQPKVFDKFFVNMVRAGEAGGALETVLIRMAEFLEKGQRIKNKIKGAMVYPIVVLVMALGILTFMMIVIIPKFADIFKDLVGPSGEMPALTQFVMSISKAFTEHGFVALFILVALVVGVRAMAATKRGRYLLDVFKLRAPVFGNLARMGAISTFARTLGTLLTGGVPMLQALTIVKDVAGNQVISTAIGQVHDAVKEGESMVTPLDASKVFPGMVIGMVQVGEETGALPDMLMKIADTYDDEVDTAVDAMTSIIEPILIIFLAVIVGTIVIAMFMPMISIIGNMSTQ